jgi:hypothetical protein
MTTYNFPATSRYYGLGIATLIDVQGRVIVYLERRLVPAPDRFALLMNHVVREGDRVDQLASTYMNDPEAFWRIADANAAMNPADLTATAGRELRITLPEGIPGIPNA